MIRIEHITKVYESKVIGLKDVNLTIEKGSIVGIIGRNGAGKSTMFKILSGVMQPTQGQCFFDGKPVTRDTSDKVSYMPEVRGLDGRKQVIDHLAELVCYKGIRRKEAKKSVEYWLERFQLSDRKFNKINTLSKGNQQKLQFIVTIASDPELLILDEPFSGLDAITCELFWNIIEELQQKGKTVIFSSHNLYEAMKRCDVFVFIKNGGIVEQGKLEAIQTNYHMILEIENESMTEGLIKEHFPDIALEQIQNTYHIPVESVETAKKIFNLLPDKFSKVFNIRKMNLQELFVVINQGG